MENKKRYILLVIIALLLSGCSCLFSSDSPLQNESMAVNAETKAKSIDKKKFIDYQVVEQPNTSKELIAVVFNTDSKINLGFIDEYGNVIKEPFLKDSNYDYYEKLRGSVGVNSFFKEYFEYLYKDENGDMNVKYYDRKFNEVILSCNEIEEYDHRRSISFNYNIELNEEKFKILKSHLDEIIKNGYETDDYNIGYNGDFYDIGFLYKIGHHILLDNNYNLLTPLYFSDRSNLNLFASPNKDSIVGNFFVEDFGLVYYNTHGDIIWITYCKDK